MATKANSKHCQTSEIELPQVVTGFRGELRILSTSKMEVVAKIVKNKKPFNSILDVWKGFEYASELSSKVKDVSFLNQFEYQR